jgi:copper chaperone NosL
MKHRHSLAIIAVFAAFGLSGCSDSGSSAELPQPVAMTEEAVGHYCNMTIFEHDGPKAQIHLKNNQFPIWFSQVRDAIAYTRLPEETWEAVAIYVHDMARANSWAEPGDDAWIDIQKAFFVIDSRMAGGMGAPETIPFGTRAAADASTSANGGKVVALADIPDAYVLSPVEIDMSNHTTGIVK